MAQTRPGQEVICESNGHIYNYEMGALAALAGVLPRVVNGEDGVLTWDAIAPAIRPKVYYRPQTSLICLENTVNMAGRHGVPHGLVVEEICDRAHEQGIHVHLDGARVFNAATYLNEHVARDDEKIRLGAVLSEQRARCSGRIDDRRQPRLHRALPADPEDARRRYAPGWGAGRCRHSSRSKRVPSACRSITTTRSCWRRSSRAIPGIALDPAKVQTNIVIFSVKPSGRSSAEFLEQYPPARRPGRPRGPRTECGWSRTSTFRPRRYRYRLPASLRPLSHQSNKHAPSSEVWLARPLLYGPAECSACTKS